MRSFAHSILILLSLLALASCSQKKSGVKLEISNNFVFGAGSLTNISQGGLMVWGRSSNGQAFGQALEGSNQIKLQLDPGSWTFYAMAWDGSTDYDGTPASNVIFGGKPSCAKSPVTKLESDAVSIDLVLDNLNCNDTAFAGTYGTATGTNGYKELSQLQLNFCSKVGLNITSPTQKCTDNFNDSLKASGKGAVSSYRVTLRNYTGPAGSRNLLPGGIKGKCVPFNGDDETGGPEDDFLYGASKNMIPGLPSGGQGYPFHMTVEIYPGHNNCENPDPGFRGVITKELINGTSFELAGNNKFYPQPGRYRQYIEVSPEKVCSTRSGTFTDHPFAGGDGTPESPYLICTVPQFHAINSAFPYLTSSFKLQANLNFNPYSNGLAASSPALFECMELGTNFLPIGYPGASCVPGSDLSWGTKYPFTGSFFGAGFKLSNLRLRAEEKDFIGLFADFQGAYLADIHLEKTELSGMQYVGGLAGHLQASKVWNITANRMNIEARDDSAAFSKVGTIFGAVQSGNVKKVIVKDSQVRGESYYVGGFAGYTIGSTISEVAIEADIDANSSADKTDVGGVIGFADSTILQFVKHEGGIYSNATKVGGILGSANSGTTLTDFYTISHLMTYQSSAAQIGGVVGEWNSGGGSNLERGYTLSIVRSKCDPSCNEGAIIGANTTTPSGTAQIYTLPTAESLAYAAALANQNILSYLINIKTPASVPDLNFAGWSLVLNEYPRFTFEEHPCHQTGFSGSGAGTLLSPKLVCNDSQYMNLVSAPAGTYHKLISNIRLRNALGGLNELSDFNAILMGNDKSLIGGYSNTSSPGSTGHIRNLNAGAIIANLKLHGMGRRTNDTSNNHGVFVANNFGTIQNIEAWVYPQWIQKGAFVGTNKPGGIISNLSIEGTYKGRNNISTITVLNEGTIQDVKTSGEFYCTEGAGCNNFSGLVDDNTGTILRANMGSRIDEVPSNPVGSASMLVRLNSGDITDVQVSEHAEFKIAPGGIAYYFHGINTGTLTRVINFGKLIDLGKLKSTSLLTPSDAGSGGIHDGVLRTGGRSGKLLLEHSGITCTGTNLTIPDWTNIVTDVVQGDPAWETDFASPLYTNLSQSAKKLIAHVRLQDGTKFTEQIISYAGSDVFGIPTNYCASTLNGEIDLYYSNDIPVDSSYVPLSGVILPQFAGNKANYLPAMTWDNQIWDIENSPTDLDEMLGYYKYILKVSPEPVVPKPWELSEDGLELFEKN